MTKTTTQPKTKYTTPGSHNLYIPSKSEQLRYANNKITLSDFDTTHPSGHAIDETANALRWTYKSLSNLGFSAWNKSYK